MILKYREGGRTVGSGRVAKPVELRWIIKVL